LILRSAIQFILRSHTDEFANRYVKMVDVNLSALLIETSLQTR